MSSFSTTQNLSNFRRNCVERIEEEFEEEGFKEDFKDMTIGYQAGLGVDIGRIGVDLRYEGNFTKFGSYITFGGQQYEFSQSPNRLLGSVTYRFGGRR